MACGTGSCAAAAACMWNKLTDSSVRVKLFGGELQVDIDRNSGDIFLTGEAVEVFWGEIDI